MASIKKRPDGKYRARYRDVDGREHARHFARKTDAQQWLDEETAKLVTGTWTDPRKAKTTVAEWCATWLSGYQRRPRTILQARSHVKHITDEFGARRLNTIRPSDVKTWVAKMKADGFADSTIYAIHSRFGQIMTDAAHDGLIPRSPTSKRTAPPQGAQRPYVAETGQVWALHDAMPEGLAPAVLLGAFAGLRLREIVALRVEDVDFMRGMISPAIQYPSDPLKTDESRTPIPIPLELALELNKMPAKWSSDTIVVNEIGRRATPTMLDKAFREARATIDGLPAGFRLHDLRHYFASLLIAAGLDIKTVQARLRHKSAKTTLDTYGHLWPDRDESSRAAVADILKARADHPRTKPASSQ
ncbi:tyrosine-type recombinase/integrase [Agromyces sp. NPDC058104]|uniref:tyrosine-type recombinase/integrase n=1 Tax=Agromyces sp. NPDC058104 TaxID=3346342 RepID=UPI0036DF4040